MHAQLRRQLLLSLALAVGCEPTEVDVAPVVNGTIDRIDTTDAIDTLDVGASQTPKRIVEEPTPVATAPSSGQAGVRRRAHDPPPKYVVPEPDPCFDCGFELPRERGRPYGKQVAQFNGNAGPAEAERWLGYALAEHASVASFARHTLELLSVGAPMALLAQATRAQADEVRHAASCLGIAKALGSTASIGPIRADLPPRRGLFEILRAVAEEGCVAEALSVWSLIDELESLENSAHPLAAEMRKVLSGLIEDETRHAQLAWRTLTWGLQRLDPNDKRQIHAALARRPPGVPSATFAVVVGRFAGSLRDDAEPGSHTDPICSRL